jgi:hypothetical protein
LNADPDGPGAEAGAADFDRRALLLVAANAGMRVAVRVELYFKGDRVLGKPGGRVGERFVIHVAGVDGV